MKLFNWGYGKESLISTIKICFILKHFLLKKLIYDIGQYGKRHHMEEGVRILFSENWDSLSAPHHFSFLAILYPIRSQAENKLS